MKRASLLWGALLGGLTSLPLMGVMYLASQVGLPFVPFDLFEGVSGRLPGNLVSYLIDQMVRLILLLQFGEISGVAKLMEQMIALATMLLVGVVFGAALGLFAVNAPWTARQGGRVGGGVLFVLIAGFEIVHGFSGNVGLGLVWLALLLVGWGALLAGWIDAAVQPRAVKAAVGEAATSRRAFLLRLLGGSVAVALAAWGLGRLAGRPVTESGAGRPLPPGAPATPSPAGGTTAARIEPAPGARPEVTPNDEFYRIDINLLPPTLNQDSWRLDAKGFLDRPRSLSLADLLTYPAVTQPVTLSCISNPIGGDLIGNAYWTGVRVGELLADLGVRPEARFLYIQATDGFYETVPLEDLQDPRTLLVYGMNGETLTVPHGFPLRIVIPNRYGMKQPKWISSIEAVSDDRSGYWVDREWSKEARPQVVSIIDPIDTAGATGGRVPVGGIAWAGGRGIRSVEVRVDSGPWEAATLRVPPLGPLTWVQWRYDWPSAPGTHTFTVRATDGAGAAQVEQEADTFPDGATGYHSLTVTV